MRTVMRSASGTSVWSDTLPAGELTLGSLLPGDIDVDVVVVGAGFTGLWTAWHLLQRDRALRVAVVERETIGFGASGRNGGWCSAILPMSLDSISHRHGRAAATRMQRAMNHNVGDIIRFAESNGIGDVCHRGGAISLARNGAQLERQRQHAAELASYGFDERDFTLLSATDVERHCRATRVVGGAYTPHCATVHPLRLTHALAAAVLSAGAAIYEYAAVETIERSGSVNRVGTAPGVIRAPVVVQATEAYTTQRPDQHRAVLPIYSLMIATEPLDDDTWHEIGLTDRPTFNDGRNMIIYGQRTTDGRLAFGGRGAPYHFGSAIRPEFDTDDRVRELLTTTLRDLFPVIADRAITHHWGGVLAAPRDWTCSVRFDRAAGLATAGGYVGDGVATSHLAGRTLAALITESTDDCDRELIRLPWVGHRSRRWEPEPLRWIGVNAGRLAAGRADAAEARTGRKSRVWGGVVRVLLGH